MRLWLDILEVLFYWVMILVAYTICAILVVVVGLFWLANGPRLGIENNA